MATVAFIAVIIACVVMSVFIVMNIITQNDSGQEHFKSTSTLINTEEIAALSVSEFVYNGIAQIDKSNGEVDYNILYNSTVKVSVDAEHINYNVDEEGKVITFEFSEFTYESPIIDVDSLRFIPSEKAIGMKDAITLCRKDVLDEAKKSEKLILLAKDNLKSIIEAWYSSIFEGYRFEFVFETAKEGSETE